MAHPTMFDRAMRLLPAMNWEMHVLHSGVGRMATRRPWLGVPLATAAILVLWLLYWAAVPLVLITMFVAWIVRPLEGWLGGRP